MSSGRPAKTSSDRRSLTGDRLGRIRGLALIVGVACIAALLGAKIAGPDGPWLWNLDLPKIDYPLASFFHDALRAGRLPLWNDNLGLGFPLYAEGQIGAFYPPNWLIYQLPPLQALDLSRFVHLVILGSGTGILGARVSGSWTAGGLAAGAIVLSGGVITKLEWTNMVAAFAWTPWILLPIIRRPAPTRLGFVASAGIWGLAALAGHPNIWAFQGIAAIIILVAVSPRPMTFLRVVAFGVIGVAVGAVQIFPTLLLVSLSDRAGGLDPAALFNNSATVYDGLGAAFANAFVLTGSNGWDLSTTWHPNGFFGILEAGAYVGLPILGLAANGLRSRRSWPWFAVAGVMIALPVLGSFHPKIWALIPILNGLRHPVRAYMFVDLALIMAATIGIARLGRSPSIARRLAQWHGPAVVLVSACAAYGLMAAIELDSIVTPFGAVGSPEAEAVRAKAIPVLFQPVPLLLELAIGLIAVAAIRLWHDQRASRGVIAVLAILPLLLFSPAANGTHLADAFDWSATPFVSAMRAANAHRVLTIEEPGWYNGMPDQLAMAGVPDLRMFSSLNLKASDEVLARLRSPDANPAERRALGIDIVVTFDRPCPGVQVAKVEDNQAAICRDPLAARPPYWIPRDAVIETSPEHIESAIQPNDAVIDVTRVATSSIAATVSSRDEGSAVFAMDAPAPGWLFVDRAWWPAWQTTINGSSLAPSRAEGGQLFAVGGGLLMVHQELVPWDAYLGLGIGAGVLVLALLWAVRSPATKPGLTWGD
ncbi:MAG: hypothetical protein ABI555_07825 [Chloroflexota bacterium]